VSDEEITNFLNSITTIAKSEVFYDIAEKYASGLTTKYMQLAKSFGISNETLKSDASIKSIIISFAKELSNEFLKNAESTDDVTKKLGKALTKELVKMIVHAFEIITTELVAGFQYDISKCPFTFYNEIGDEIIEDDDESLLEKLFNSTDVVCRITDESKFDFAHTVLFDTIMKQFGWWFSFIHYEAERLGAAGDDRGRHEFDNDIWNQYSRHSVDYTRLRG